MNSNNFCYTTRRDLIRLLLVAALVLPGGPIASANEYRIDGISIDHPWAMPLPPVSPNGAVYMVITNTGESMDRLLGGSTSMADKVEIHSHVHKDGQMQMKHLANGLELAGGEVAEFTPGQLHLMLIDLNRPLVEGEQFPLTLEFEQAGSIDLVVAIEANR